VLHGVSKVACSWFDVPSSSLRFGHSLMTAVGCEYRQSGLSLMTAVGCEYRQSGLSLMTAVGCEYRQSGLSLRDRTHTDTGFTEVLRI